MHMNPSRRAFVVASTVAAAGTAGCQAHPGDRQLTFASLAAAEEEIARLMQAKALDSGTTWSWAQTLAHCAQSIEFSMSGFPQPKSRLFQRTVGSLAFETFAWRGRMTHDLAEPIPGAPLLEPESDAVKALARLRASVQQFRQWTGALQPHFAYGDLDKREYEQAHAMHLANHLSAFRVRGAEG